MNTTVVWIIFCVIAAALFIISMIAFQNACNKETYNNHKYNDRYKRYNRYVNTREDRF